MHRVVTRKKGSSLLSKLFKVFLWCFVVLNALLIYYLYLSNYEIDCSKTGSCTVKKVALEKFGQRKYLQLLHKYFTLSKNEWRLSPLPSREVFLNTNELNCSSLLKIDKARFVAAGYTKSTFAVKLKNKTISLKTVNVEGHDMHECRHEGRDIYDCFLSSASKLLKEIAILKSISHPNIVQVFGYCIPINPDIADPKHTVAIFEEYGEPIEVIRLLQLSWEDRLQITLGLSRLLKHLSSFQETIALNDFRRQQFILVNGDPKLIDVDDVGLTEHQCDNAPCCLNPLLVNRTICISCVNHICKGYNEKVNIIRMGKHFIRHILPHGAPKELNSKSHFITDAFLLASLEAKVISDATEDLVYSFKNGLYRKSVDANYLLGYKLYDHREVSSNFDYHCQLAIGGHGCTTSVVNEEEAAEICWTDSKCKAFVLTGAVSWTGRKIVSFKSGFGNLLQNSKTKLFIKL